MAYDQAGHITIKIQIDFMLKMPQQEKFEKVDFFSSLLKKKKKSCL